MRAAFALDARRETTLPLLANLNVLQHLAQRSRVDRTGHYPNRRRAEEGQRRGSSIS